MSSFSVYSNIKKFQPEFHIQNKMNIVFLFRDCYSICITDEGLKQKLILYGGRKMENINWGLIAPIIVIQVVLMVIAIVDIIRINRTNGPKWLWVLIVIFINILGSILYFVIGRKQNK